MKKFDHPYNPKEVEEKIYALWEQSGFFTPENLPNRHKKPFTIIMPPPNANGSLHIGHALFVTLEDIIIRYKRMRGFKTLWLPGADHAGFETQVVFEKKLEKEGRNRFEIPKEELFREMLDFTQKNKKLMYSQLKKLGASCDWSREKFTLDPEITGVVYDTFKKLYDDGLAYRDLRIVNWCTKHQTALSDLEVKYAEREDSLYYIKYGPLTLATVRPETKFGDTALAVNPKDRRYQKYIGKIIEAKGLLGPLKFKVIADEAVDSKFGTGVVKITPAHDAADFEIWQRHKNEIPGPKIIIDERGRLTAQAGPYAGIKISEAREKVAYDMKNIEILQKIEPYKHQVATCYKCGTILEPLPRTQWFIRMTEAPHAQNQKSKIKNQNLGKSLRDLAVDAVKTGKIKFVTQKFEKIFLHWMKNLRDWNISRQIIWGIRIPAWYHAPLCIPKPGREKDIEKCKAIIIATSKPRCEFCDAEYTQDPDVFDTWFSSGQWPYAALLSQCANSKSQIPNSKCKDFEEFYPTSVIETGWDILFFWVARMIMLGIYRTGKIPFKTIYLHGLVRDKDRQKMSKSKGNVIDPLGISEVYGADALRMALITSGAAGTDPVISEEKIRGYRNFANKVWQATRFLLQNIDRVPKNKKVKFSKSEKAALKKLAKLKSDVTYNMESYKFHLAAHKLYHFFWHYYADKIIESSKSKLKSEKENESDSAKALLLEFHTTLIKLLHPFMPFITEEIYRNLPIKQEKMLMIEKW